MRKRGRKLLIAALAASIIFHAALASFVRWSTPHEDRAEFVTFAKRTVVRIAPKSPRRIPRAAPRAHEPARSAILPRPNAPTLTAARGKSTTERVANVSSGAATPGATPLAPSPTVPPLPARSPSGACSKPNAPAAVATQGPVPPLPPEARAKQTNGVAAIDVKLDEAGRVLTTSVASTTGNPALDLAAVAMAREATYSPRYVACKAIAADYTFAVKFSGW